MMFDLQVLAFQADITRVITFLIGRDEAGGLRDGDGGNLLDQLTLVYGSGLSDGNRHDHSPLPIIVAGGGSGQIKGGAHIASPKDTPMTNLLLSALATVGVRMDKLGDSTGMLDLRPS